MEARLVRACQATDESGGRANWRSHNSAYSVSDCAANRAADGVASPCALAGWGILGVSRDWQSCQQDCEDKWFGHHSNLQTGTL
jgi:hypothetical protein